MRESDKENVAPVKPTEVRALSRRIERRFRGSNRTGTDGGRLCAGGRRGAMQFVSKRDAQVANPEPLLKHNPKRFVLFPIQYHDVRLETENKRRGRELKRELKKAGERARAEEGGERARAEGKGEWEKGGNGRGKAFPIAPIFPPFPSFNPPYPRAFVFPDSQIWQMYKKAVASNWTVEEVELSKDMVRPLSTPRPLPLPNPFPALFPASNPFPALVPSPTLSPPYSPPYSPP